MKRAFGVGLKTAGGVASVSGLALVSGPTLALIGAVVFTVIVSLCWIVADPGRTKHLATLIKAARGS